MNSNKSIYIPKNWKKKWWKLHPLPIRWWVRFMLLLYYKTHPFYFDSANRFNLQVFLNRSWLMHFDRLFLYRLFLVIPFASAWATPELRTHITEKCHHRQSLRVFHLEEILSTRLVGELKQWSVTTTRLASYFIQQQRRICHQQHQVKSGINSPATPRTFVVVFLVLFTRQEQVLTLTGALQSFCSREGNSLL